MAKVSYSEHLGSFTRKKLTKRIKDITEKWQVCLLNKEIRYIKCAYQGSLYCEKVNEIIYGDLVGPFDYYIKEKKR